MRTLGDGNSIPALGLGTLNMSSNEAFKCLSMAFKNGYRLIDTSPVYQNEEAIGAALEECLKQGLVKREEIFVTSKLWITDRNSVKDAVKKTLKALRLDYIDLYMIHYMTPDIVKDTLMVDRVSIQEVWRQMEHCKDEGLIRSIGVMNCSVVMFLEILTFCTTRPALNCLEMHPYFTQDEAMSFYKKLKIPVAAFSPLASHENLKTFDLLPASIKNLDLMSESLIKDLAKKYSKSPAQIILNWHMHHEQIIFPGMREETHFLENGDIFNFELSQDELKKISGLNRNARLFDRIQDENYSYIPYWL
jgi:diketogulonate reductase-like aldo/keto reductase